MKKIYMFCECTRADNYGIGTYVKQLIKSFSGRSNLLLNIVTLFSNESIYTVKTSGNCIYHYIPACVNLDIRRIKQYYRNAWYLLQANINFEKNEDLLYFHFNSTNEYPLITLIKADLPHSSVIFTIHYQSWCFALSGNSELLKKIISSGDHNQIEQKIYASYLKELSLYCKVDKIVCLSKFTYEIVRNIYQVSDDKLHIIYNNLNDEGVLLSLAEKRDLKRTLFLNEFDQLILFVGRLDRIKGIHFLIDAFKEILKEKQDCHLIIVGDGDFSYCLEKSNSIWSKVTFTGFINKEELYNYYKVADIGVIPSMHEQCSYVAIEMMMFGLRIVSSDSTGLNEMIDNEDFKALTQYGNNYDAFFQIKDLKDRILSLLNKKENITNNRQRYLDVYCSEFENTINMLY